MADRGSDSGTSPEAESVAPAPLTESQLRDLLRQVKDPDLGVNVVDLGLIYELRRQADGRVEVEMTLTTPSCPFGPHLVRQVHAALEQADGVREVAVAVVWEPPWSADYVSEEIKLELGLDY